VVRVPGSDLVRVRIGRFTQREEAEDLARELRDLGFETTVISDAQLEEGVG
jgi:hypothetical protein